MSNVDSIISEIKLSLSKYADAGLLDDNLMYSDAVKALKRFGNDICVPQEAFVEISGGKGKLPAQFFSISLALECEPDYCKTENVSLHSLQNSVFYRERVTKSDEWNECDTCCETKSESIIKENVYFDGGGMTTFVYKQPRLLTLAKGIKKSVCSTKCMNYGVVNNPHEINIFETTMQANFNKGTAYIRYNGLPVDEDGFIDIPDTKNGHLATYVEYYIKRRIAESLLGNNDAQGIEKLYPIYKAEETTALRNATNEVKMTNLRPKELRRKWKIKNRLEVLTFEINMLNGNS